MHTPEKYKPHKMLHTLSCDRTLCFNNILKLNSMVSARRTHLEAVSTSSLSFFSI